MNNRILAIYFERSGLSLDYMQEKVHKNFDQFLAGEKRPTFNQLTAIAKAFSIPVGLLLLDEPLERESEAINFRTVDSEYLVSQSRELQDTIAEMRDKQTFLREEIEDELAFVGRFAITDDHRTVAGAIREVLGIQPDYYRHLTRNNILKYLREKINEIGVFVFFNGKVKDNPHRVLNAKEFRGFVLVDQKAPLIFINQKDTKNGQLFTLIHELVHIFIGDEEILGAQQATLDFDPTEAFVNRVTAEILVPNVAFLEKYQQTQEAGELANFFKVSEFVILRRMLDNRKISSAQYREGTELLLRQYEARQKLMKEKKSGGNYRNNINFRIDQRFFGYVENALNSQKISYTDAFRIVGVSYKGYDILRGSR